MQNYIWLGEERERNRMTWVMIKYHDNVRVLSGIEKND